MNKREFIKNSGLMGISSLFPFIYKQPTQDLIIDKLLHDGKRIYKDGKMFIVDRVLDESINYSPSSFIYESSGDGSIAELLKHFENSSIPQYSLKVVKKVPQYKFENMEKADIFLRELLWKNNKNVDLMDKKYYDVFTEAVRQSNRVAMDCRRGGNKLLINNNNLNILKREHDGYKNLPKYWLSDIVIPTNGINMEENIAFYKGTEQWDAMGNYYINDDKSVDILMSNNFNAYYRIYPFILK